MPYAVANSAGVPRTTSSSTCRRRRLGTGALYWRRKRGILRKQIPHAQRPLKGRFAPTLLAQVGDLRKQIPHAQKTPERSLRSYTSAAGHQGPPLAGALRVLQVRRRSAVDADDRAGLLHSIGEVAHLAEVLRPCGQAAPGQVDRRRRRRSSQWRGRSPTCCRRPRSRAATRTACTWHRALPSATGAPTPCTYRRPGWPVHLLGGRAAAARAGESARRVMDVQVEVVRAVREVIEQREPGEPRAGRDRHLVDGDPGGRPTTKLFVGSSATVPAVVVAGMSPRSANVSAPAKPVLTSSWSSRSCPPG